MRKTSDLNEIVPLVSELEQESNSEFRTVSPIPTIGGVAVNQPMAGLSMTPVQSQGMFAPALGTVNALNPISVFIFTKGKLRQFLFFFKH